MILRITGDDWRRIFADDGLLMPQRQFRPAVRQDALTDEERFQEWQGKLGRISSDVGNLLLGRHIFRRIDRLVAQNPKVDGLFVRWLRINYATSAALGIRRQLDTDAKAVSLTNLLRDLIKHSTVITRSRFLWLKVGAKLAKLPIRRPGRAYHPSRKWRLLVLELPYWTEFFDELCGGVGLAHLSKKLIGQDLQEFQKKAASMRWTPKFRQVVKVKPAL